MIRITVTVVGDDFKTVNRLLKQTIEQGVDTISQSDGSSLVEVSDLSNPRRMIHYSKLVKGE